MVRENAAKYGSITIDDDVDASSSDTESRQQPSKTAARVVLGACFLCLALVLLHGIASSGGGEPKSDPGSVPASLPAKDHDENEALFYKHQIVDHFAAAGNDEDQPDYWTHRYYKSTKYFAGAGHPILLVVGGEGSLDNGMLYPFVTEVLAKRFGAAVVQPEHRFYGPYKPVKHASTDQLLKLLTPHQAMADMLHLVKHHLHETDFKDCSLDRSSPDYCPLITIGGSYPGFLSAMFRLVYPDIVDAAYASSAPLKMYAQIGDPDVYYDIVTSAAERMSPGCAHSVKATLTDVVATIQEAETLKEAAAAVGVCVDTIPAEITSQAQLGDDLVTLATYAFADYDMGAYPPGVDNGLYKVCQVFQDPDLDSLDTMASFFRHSLMETVEEDLGCSLASVNCTDEEKMKALEELTKGRSCYDMSEGEDDADDDDDDSTANGDDAEEKELDDADDDGTMWNFQTCTNVIFVIGLSSDSMFPTHNRSYKSLLNELTKDCRDEFGVTPRPHELVNEWGFDDLVGAGASRILFTNGLQDMWSGGGILEDLSDSLLALTFENGAHHSDLSHEGPTDADTDDIKEGFVKITEILEGWIAEIKSEGGSSMDSSS